MSGFIKPRAIPAGSRDFGARARAARAATSGGRFQQVEGQYSDFYPKEKALWFALCPGQKWSFDIYDREAGEVVRMEDEFFFGYVNHRVQRVKRNFVCSAGAHKDKPCWGCAIRNQFYDKKRERREETGVDEKGEAPIGAMTQYAFAGVVLEHHLKLPVTDKNGNVRKNKSQQIIMRDVPTPLIEDKELVKKKKAAGESTFGLAVHWSCGITHFNSLISLDEELKGKCATCGEDLFAQYFECPECKETHELLTDDGDIYTGETLRELRGLKYRCTCSNEVFLTPLVECTCGEPVEGKLVDFAIRIKSEKVGEKQSVLKLVECKPLAFFIDKHERLKKMLDEPLQLDKIFAPAGMSLQTTIIPEDMRGDGLSPAPRAKKDAKPAAGPYPLNDDSDEDAAE